MQLYRLPTKLRKDATSNPQDRTPAPAEGSLRQAQTAGAAQDDALASSRNGDLKGVLTSPYGTWSFCLILARHWRFYLASVGAGAMVLLLADRIVLLLSALGQLITRNGSLPGH